MNCSEFENYKNFSMTIVCLRMLTNIKVPDGAKMVVSAETNIFCESRLYTKSLCSMKKLAKYGYGRETSEKKYWELFLEFARTTGCNTIKGYLSSTLRPWSEKYCKKE